MSDASPLGDLLDRAKQIFGFIAELGSRFHAEREGTAVKYFQLTGGDHDEGGKTYKSGDIIETTRDLDNIFENKFKRWPAPDTIDAKAVRRRCEPLIGRLWELLLGMKDTLKSPPDEFKPVVPFLSRAAKFFQSVRNAPHAIIDFLDDYAVLNSIARDGSQAVEAVTRTHRVDEPFAFLDDMPKFSSLNDYPDSRVGHIDFLEWVCREVNGQAKALRDGAYPDESIVAAIRGIKWAEARDRFSALSGITGVSRDVLTPVFQRELNIGTVEGISEVLTRFGGLIRKDYEDHLRLKDAVVVEPPELIEIRDWVNHDGIKGFFNSNLFSADGWGVQVDARHRDIAFLLHQLLGGDPSEQTIRKYLYDKHGLLPSEPINLTTLFNLLKSGTEAIRKPPIEPTKQGTSPEAPSIIPEVKSDVQASGNSKHPFDNADSECVTLDHNQVLNGYLGGTALADSLGIHPSRREAFFRKLERVRIKLGDTSWQEIRDPRPNCPKFLYLASLPQIRELAEDYRKEK